MSIVQKPFGQLSTGEEIAEYTLTNRNGASVSVLTYGATVRSICVPDRNGKLTDVNLGFDDMQGYESKSAAYMGGVVGRYANRIGMAGFDIDGVHYELAQNDGKNSLHGGLKGFRDRIWTAQPMDEEEPRLLLTLFSPHMDQDYPGNMRVEVIYTLNNHNGLNIHYKATTDRTTVINLTNHAYFNLNGHDGGYIGDHILQINAPYMTEAGEGLVPNGKLVPTVETAANFTKPVALDTVLSRIDSDAALKMARGVDFNYAAGREKETKLIATLYAEKTGIAMDVITDQPGVQCYTAQGLHTVGKGGANYGPYSAVCLETQHYPDSVHQPYFPSAVLRPQDVFDSFTEYRFSVR